MRAQVVLDSAKTARLEQRVAVSGTPASRNIIPERTRGRRTSRDENIPRARVEKRVPRSFSVFYAPVWIIIIYNAAIYARCDRRSF